jgi:tetratricopeptide (TPR) repeat protein/transglutaminase-like putative cysteine protease
MMGDFVRLLLTLLVACLAAAAPADAQAPREPGIAPVPDWVERMTVPTPNPALRDRPVQTLLLTGQSRYGADRHDHYAELAFLIQNAQGLQGLGSIELPWQPDQGELIVHKVQIVRGGTVIDLLANGQHFTVLRRENNLESAVLDGMLTAVMQPEGLAVGDVLDVAFTMRRHASALPLRGEITYTLPYGAPVRHAYLRQIWPAGMQMRWRGTGVMERARTRTTRLGTELVLDLADAEGPQPPEQAPPRLAVPTSLQISEYRDWAEVSSAVAPHYARAEELGPASPLRARIERIAASSPDPRVRAMAALRLVQDEIRYFALVMGDGNYLPATADQTWSRRFADCKGKVVTLLALLHGLGIEAEPVLVNAQTGDALDELLPAMSAFNHVIVRARIDGRSYWLDGTRNGDRNLSDLASATFVRGLPVRAGGAALEPIPYAPPALPLVETNITYDGSAGFQEPVPIRVERTVRGDVATAMRVALSQIGRDEFLRQTRQNEASLPGGDGEIASVDLRDDQETGAFTVIVAGRTRMDWARAPGAASQRFRFDNATISWTVNFDRPAGPFHDAPFAFPIPAYLASTETIILPRGGEGFSIEGQNFDHLVAGTRISRQISIANGRATARSEFRRVEREISAATARSGAPLIGTIRGDQAYLRAAMGAVMPAPRTAARAAPPGDAEALVQSGYDKMGAGRARPALADFDRAIALAPQWALAHADRGIALIHLGRLDEAEASLASALRLDDTEFAAHQGMGRIAQMRGRGEDAVRAYTRSLELRADNVATLSWRAEAYASLGRFDDALADMDRILAREPNHAIAHASRARILAQQGHQPESLAAIDRALAADPGNFAFAVMRADLLARFGRADEAAAAYRAALAMLDSLARTLAGEPGEAAFSNERMAILSRSGRTAEAVAIADATLRRYAGNTLMLAARCGVRVEGNVELAQAQRDCDQALRDEPGHPIATPARAMLDLRRARWAEAISDFTRTLADEPRSARALYGRGVARVRSGDTAGQADIADARRIEFDIDWEFARLGLGLPAEAAASAAAH